MTDHAEDGTRRLSRRARLNALPPNVRGALWMIGAASMFALMTVVGKILGATFDPLQITWAVQVVALVIVVPVALAAGRPLLPRGRRVMHVVRALCGYSGFICFLIAIQFLPLADAVSLSFATPLFMVVWAALFLGESVRWRRATATAIGFVGVVVMMRPGQAAIEPAALVAILGAMFGATAMTLIKRLTVHDDNVTLMASFAIVAGIAGVGPALWVWQMPGWSDLPWLAAIGLGGVAGQYMLIRAYRAGEASVVAPFDYSRLILSTILGYLVFREVPDLWTGVGAAIIIASTFYIARREARRGIAPAVTPGGGVNP